MTYNADLYIIAAGKGSRMGGNVPKALVPITNEPNLTTTLKQIGNKFKNVFIVTNEDIQDQWVKYFASLDESLFSNVTNISIRSGLGDGHAVLNALKQTTNYFNHEIVVVWGDVFFPFGEIIDELLTMPANGRGLIPAKKVDNPYVTIITDDQLRIKSADFSKYNEIHAHGFHDQSVFRFNKPLIIETLTTLHDSLWKNGQYLTQSGELSLLYAFHYLQNIGKPLQLYETCYPTLSFNTPQEVQHIQKEINEKWSSQS